MSDSPFRDPRHFSLFSNELAEVVGCLNTGRTENVGVVAVHASSKGYRITLNGRTISSGKTPVELQKNHVAEREKAKAKSGLPS